MSGARKLFELVGADPSRPFSPYCWRIRMALAHKGLEAETVPWRFTQKEAIRPYGSEKVPVLLDGDRAVADSLAIAMYLEDSYPDRPSLFGGAGGRAAAAFQNGWGDVAVIGGLFPLIVADIAGQLDPADEAYFRESRQARFKRSLEDVAAERDAALPAFRRSLDPMRLALRKAPFLGGASPLYADYIVFGPFQWARIMSPYAVLAEDDPIHAWRERMLDLFGGLARRVPAYGA